MKSANLEALCGIAPLRYGASDAVSGLLLWSNVDDEALHEILIRANTYAIIEAVEVTRDTDMESCRFTARINAPSARSAVLAG